MSGEAMKHKVIIIDDDLQVLSAANRCVKRLGYEPLAYHNFSDVTSIDDVARQIEIHRPAAIFTDNNMPVFTGQQLLDCAAREYPYIGRILMSGLNDPEGICPHLFVPKPFDSASLKSALDQAVSGYEQWKQAQVLIVDDEPGMCGVLVEALRPVPYEIVTARDGNEALRKINGNLAAIVTDTHMPGMDGVTLLSRVSQSYPEAKRFLMSGDKRIHSDHAHYKFEKPFGVDEFRHALDRAVEEYISKMQTD